MYCRTLVAPLLAVTVVLSGCTPSSRGAKPTPVPAPPPSSQPAQPTQPTAPSQPPVEVPPSPQGAAQATWIDASASPFAVRGVVEGFYGDPWTQEKRLAAFDFMARVGLNTYVYAPKDDPYQRSDWRKPYPAAQLGQFQTLLSRAGQDGINFVYSISPGLDITYSSTADRQALAAKLDQLRSLGIHTVMLSLDDVPEQLNAADNAVYDQNLASAQADLANWLYGDRRAADPQFVLWMAQSHYWGTQADAYLTTLGSRLNLAVPLIWTGPDVLSTTITAADTDTIAAIIKRKPIIWDNYPVNDYTYAVKKKPRLIMGAVTGRDPNLSAHVSGYLINPMIQEEASQLPMYTTAAYLANPTGYDPDAAWRDGANHLSSNGATLLEFASYAQISAVYDQDSPALAQAIAGYWRGEAGATAQLREQFTAMTSLPSRLHEAVSPGFYAEVSPWVVSLAHRGTAGLLALEVDAAVGQGDAATVRARLPELRQQLAAIQAEQATANIAVQLAEDFTAQVIKRAEALAR
jgi:hyaluronoglucosaminidase